MIAMPPGLTMPTFSRAISAFVLPNHSMWSRSTLVMTLTIPSAVLVASHRPPAPTSMTPASTASSPK